MSLPPPLPSVSSKNGAASLRHPLFMQGYRCIEEKDWVGAEQYLETLRLSRPEAAGTWLLEGLLARSQGDDQRCREALELALQAAPQQAIILLPLAALYQRAQDIDQAELYLTQALEVEPESAEIYDQLARLALGSQRISLAVEASEQAVKLAPQSGEYWNTYGVALGRCGRRDDAIAAWRKALELAPNSRAVQCNLAEQLWKQGGLDEAEALYKSALQTNHETWVAVEGLAQVYRRQKKLAAAAEILKAELERHDTLAVRLLLIPALAGILRDSGKSEEALEWLARLDGHHTAITLNVQATIYMAQSDNAAAAATLREALKLDENNPDLWANLALLAISNQDIEDADLAISKAIEFGVHLNSVKQVVANWSITQNRFEQGEALYREILDDNPTEVAAWANLAYAQFQSQAYPRAIETCQKAMEIGAISAPLFNTYGCCLLEMRDLEGAMQVFIESVRLSSPSVQPDKDFSSFLSNLCFAIHYSHEATLEEFEDLLRRYSRFIQSEGEDPEAPYLLSKDPDRVLRIGYISPDFRVHSVAYFLEPILAQHDRSAVHVTLYSCARKEDRMTQRLESLADDFVRVATWNDRKTAARIREDKIDILIDLAGHTASNRLPMLALRPAPLQFTWLGYPASTGLSEVNGRFVDALTDPEDTQEWASERLIRLPRCFLAYGGQPNAPEPREAPPMETNGFITFGSFNASYKICSAVVEAWAEILLRVPTGRLFLKSKQFLDPATRDALLAQFAALGIVAERIELSPHIASFEGHLRLYERIDLALDTFPYNGTTTTCEAMWMGVPTLAIAGDHHAARVSVSLMSAVGLEKQLVAKNREDYINRAVSFASSPEALREVRHGLRERMASSPLCDAEGLARAMEAEMRLEWRRWCAAPGPTHGRKRTNLSIDSDI